MTPTFAGATGAGYAALHLAFSRRRYTSAMTDPRRLSAVRGREHRARRLAARALAPAVSRVSRLTGHAGTSFPGYVAERVDPGILADLADGIQRPIVVLGTNGKTTTTRLIAAMLEHSLGVRPISNRSGANLRQGIVTTLLSDARPSERPPAVLEVDEVAFSELALVLRPAIVVVMNLLRDQLDRYGEIDAVIARWRHDFSQLPTDTILVACADDARVESVIRDAGRPVVRFGLWPSAAGDPLRGGTDGGPIPDAPSCPTCGSLVAFDGARWMGLGEWACPGCGDSRAMPDVGVRIADGDPGDDLVHLELAMRRSGDGLTGIGRVTVPLIGSAAAYDVAAAVAAGLAVGVPPRDAVTALDGTGPAFGRLEEIAVGDRTVLLTLAKNPTSVAHAVEAAARRHPDHVLLGLADRAADGRDTSWIWDARLDALAGSVPLTLTGVSADDLAVRLKYGGGPAVRSPVPMTVDRHVDSALSTALERVPPDGTLMVVATYTILWRLRRALERRRLAPSLPR